MKIPWLICSIGGEPLLHPNASNIIEILNYHNLFYSISTNASRVVDFEVGLLKKLKFLTISMPGFSQESYDRIHGFDFEKILFNIEALIANFRKAGFRGSVCMAYHIYQFNLAEILPARSFCSERGIIFSPSIAYINDYNLAFDYLKKLLDYDTLNKLGKDLLLYYVDDLIKDAPASFECPQYEYLTLNASCDVLTCCCLPRNHDDYSIGSVFELSSEEIVLKKRQQQACRECLSLGLAYWVHNPLVPKVLEDFKKRSFKDRSTNYFCTKMRKAIPVLLERCGVNWR